MDSFEINKLLAAVLGTLFVVMSVGIMADAMFAASVPAQPGYLIEATEVEAGAGDEAEAEESIAALLVSANPDAGATAFKKCAACHTTEQGGANKVGPNLWDIVNRPAAAHPGFGYSSGMRAFAESGHVWDFDTLSDFLTAPKAVVKGTAMAFAGLKKPEERADVIAYLRSLSDAPAPLPEAAAPVENVSAPAEGDEPAPAGGAAAPAEPAPEAEPAGEDPAQQAAPDVQPEPAAPVAPAEGGSPAEGAAPPQ
jgi:cytochrome c